MEALRKFAAWIDRKCVELEQSAGRVGAAVALSLILLLVACIFVAPELRPVNLGCSYAAYSKAPFDWTPRGKALHWTAEIGEFRSRFLTPALGYGLHLRGNSFIVLPVVMGLALSCAVYLFSRKQGVSPGASCGMSALVMLASPMLTLLRFPGYVDTTTYLLLFCAFLAAPSPWWAVLFGVSLFNHESGVFMGPWLAWAAIGRKPTARKVALNVALIILAVLPVLAYHKFLQARGLMPFSENYYLSFKNVLVTLDYTGRYLPAGIFQGFRLFWFFPIAALFIHWQRRNWYDLAGLLLVLVGAAAILMIATDSSRLVAIAFPAVILGALTFRSEVGHQQFVLWLWALVLLNFLVQPFYVAQSFAMPLTSLPSNILGWLIQSNWTPLVTPVS